MTVKVCSIYVNLPVKKLSRSIAFFKALDFEFNEEFKEDKGASLVINESIFVLLLVDAFFASFTHQRIADTAKENEVILTLQVGSKEEVDELVNKAIEQGAEDETTALSEEKAMMDYRRIEDLDGHLWEIMYIDRSVMAN